MPMPGNIQISCLVLFEDIEGFCEKFLDLSSGVTPGVTEWAGAHLLCLNIKPQRKTREGVN